MAFTKKRLVATKTAATGAGTSYGKNAAYLKSIVFAGTDESEAAKRDIYTHGVSFVQDPLNEREKKISGLDTAVDTSISGTVIASIGAEGATSGAVDASKGITLKNLNEALKALNAYVNEVKGDADDELKVTMTSDANEDNKYAMVYTLTQGADTEASRQIGKINIPKDQFLSSADFRYATAADAAKSSDFDEGDPILVFEWQLDGDFAGANGKAISYVPVKDLVDTYQGTTTKSGAVNVAKIMASSVDGTTVTAVDNGTYAVAADTYTATVTLDEPAEGDNTNGAGKVIKVTLNQDLYNDVAAGKYAEANAKVYADNLKKETDYALIGKSTAVFYELGAESGSAADGDLVRAETVTKVLGSSDLPTVADALNKLGDAIETNAGNITELQNAGAATKAIVDSLRVQDKKFSDPDDETGLRNVTLYGNEITLAKEPFTGDYAGKEFGLTNATTISTALQELAEAWVWEEVQS